jgi:hypothetical protein
MYSFLVLGLIPGTNIRITFSAWLALVALIVVAGLRIRFGRPQVVRQILPAARLHRRFN